MACFLFRHIFFRIVGGKRTRRGEALGFTRRIHATEYSVAVVPAESPGDGDVLKMNGTTRVGGWVAPKDAGAKAADRAALQTLP